MSSGSNVDAFCDIVLLQPIMETKHKGQTTQVLLVQIHNPLKLQRNRCQTPALHRGHSRAGVDRSEFYCERSGVSLAQH